MYVLMSYRKPKFEAVLSPPRYSEGHRRRQRDVNISAAASVAPSSARGAGHTRDVTRARARARAACPAPIGLRPPRALRPPRDETLSGMAVVCDGRDAPYLSVRPRKYPPRKKIAFNNNSLIPRA